MNNSMDTVSRFDAISPLDYRYYGDNPEFFKRLQPYVSEAANIRYLLRVELALVKTLAKWGVCSDEVAKEVEAACEKITPGQVYDEERRVQHNIRALVNCIRENISPESRPYVHLFATSSDIMDTAAALRYKELIRDVVLDDLFALEKKLIEIAKKHSNQVQMGRTHGQHAVPTTFGYTMALFVSRIGSRIQTINTAHENLRGKLSGAVGAFNALSLYVKEPSKFERDFLKELGLKPSDTSVSSQIIEPEPVTDLAYAVVSCFSVLANLADDMRNLIRSEIGEIVDIYHAEEVGSSTMPHKMNPKNFENVKSFWKEFMPRMFTVFMDQISEHQRDLTNSASSRFLPELFTGFSYATTRMTDALSKIETNPTAMESNMNKGKDLVAAEPLYILLALQGYPDAYDVVRTLSRKSRATGAKLIDLAMENDELAGYLKTISEDHKRILADPTLYIGDAPGRTLATCEYWERVCKSIEKALRSEGSAHLKNAAA
jgi:adenylosuccinate lyase